MKILILEDNIVSAKALYRRLELQARRHEVTVEITMAKSLKDAVELLGKNEYEVIICDLLLPDTSDEKLDEAPAKIREICHVDTEIMVLSARLGQDPVLKRHLEEDLQCVVFSKEEMANSDALLLTIFGSKKIRRELEILRQRTDPMAEANAANRRMAGAATSAAFVAVITAICFGKQFDTMIVIFLMGAICVLIGISTGDVIKILTKLGDK